MCRKAAIVVGFDNYANCQKTCSFHKRSKEIKQYSQEEEYMKIGKPAIFTGLFTFDRLEILE